MTLLQTLSMIGQLICATQVTVQDYASEISTCTLTMYILGPLRTQGPIFLSVASVLLSMKQQHAFSEHSVTSICLALHMLGDDDEAVRTSARPLLCHLTEGVVPIPFEDTCHIGFNSSVGSTQVE